jgi:hypothetical protein
MPRPKNEEPAPAPKKRGRPKGSKNSVKSAPRGRPRKIKAVQSTNNVDTPLTVTKSSEEKELFPHIGFPYRLEYMEDKDKKICFFQCENHMEKHITRHKLNRKTCKISIKEN